MLGFFLGADWSVCVLRRTNHRQAGKVFYFFLIGSSQSAESLRTAVSLSSWLPIGRGKKCGGGSGEGGRGKAKTRN